MDGNAMIGRSIFLNIYIGFWLFDLCTVSASSSVAVGESLMNP